MSTVKLSAPIVRIVLDLTNDGNLTEYTVQTDNRDAVRWDMTRGRENWPAADVAPMLWATFMAWSALTRTGEYSGKFVEFNDLCLEAAMTAPENGTDEVNPTSAGLEPA